MGQHEYRLKSLADDELLAGLSRAVERRNQVRAEFLAYLAELDERQLFLELGFASLFEYCVVALGLCESTAGRHISAARVCRNHPRVFALVASGALHASALSLLRKHRTPENAAELFELCTRRSARKVEESLAARFPRPDVRDLVRRLPVRAALTPDVERASEKGQTEAPAPDPLLDPSGEMPGELPRAFVESPRRDPAAALGSTEPPKARRLEPQALTWTALGSGTDRARTAWRSRVIPCPRSCGSRYILPLRRKRNYRRFSKMNSNSDRRKQRPARRA